MKIIKQLYRLLTPNILKGFVIIYYLTGVIGLLHPLPQSFFETLVPLSLIISILLLGIMHRPWNLRFIITCCIIWVLSFLIEVAGVKTGKIFGDYFYGNGLGIKLLDVPLLIGINWLILTYSVIQVLKNRMNMIALLMTGSFLLVIFDLVLEPVAIHYSWWIWQKGAVPLQNYIAWYFTSIVLLFILVKSGPQDKNPLAPWILITQFIFFLILNLFV